MYLIQICIISYLIGCIPIAFLLVKIFKKKDIRQLGSGNVGTLNTLETTNSKTLAIITLLGDILKGIFALILTNYLFPKIELSIVVCSITCVLGHNFNVFLKFKGGRGLATSAGIFLIINPQLLVYWLSTWLISKHITKDILKSNIIATVISPILILFFFYWND